MGGNGNAQGPAGPPFAYARDPEILGRLLQDGRASLSVLAKDMGEDAYRQKAWRRLKELEQSVIWGYTAVIDESAVGWTNYLVTAQISKLSPDDLSAVRQVFADLGKDTDIRLQSLQVTTDDAMQWIGQFSARSVLVARRAVQAVHDAAPAAFVDKPRLVEIAGSIARGGKINPDRKHIEHLLEQWS